jgi:hypothetical protein
MFKTSASILATAMLLAFAAQANAALLVDTGTPSGAGFALAVDGNDWLAGQMHFNAATQINSIQAYLDGGNNGDSFTIALYDNTGNLPGNVVNTAAATFNSTGWNGASNLNWSVGAGDYWVAIEVQGSDTLNFGAAPVGAPHPLSHTAFNPGSGYQLTSQPLSFGVQVDGTTVPVPAAAWLLGSGLLGLVGVARRSKA